MRNGVKTSAPVCSSSKTRRGRDALLFLIREKNSKISSSEGRAGKKELISESAFFFFFLLIKEIKFTTEIVVEMDVDTCVCLYV